MTRRLVVANQKGGIGKTTTVANLGRAFAELGKKVLLVDLDPQGGLSASYGVNSYETRRSTYQLLMDPSTPLVKVLHPLKRNLLLAPASMELASAEVMLTNRKDRVTRLRTVLDNAPGLFDLILIDTPPTLGILTANGLVAARELIIPVQSQYLAMRGVRSLIETVERLQKTGLNPNLRLTGVIATMHHPSSSTSTEAIAEMREVFGDRFLNPVIEYDPSVAEAPAAEESLLDYAPHHPIAHAYRKLAEEILNHG